MANVGKYLLFCVFTMALLVGACVSAPRIEKPQYTQRHYTFSVLLDPEKPVDSPELDIAISLLRMEYPAQQAEHFYEILYLTDNLDAYKDRVIEEQRRRYRGTAHLAGQSDNWRYSETLNIKQSQLQGMVIQHAEGINIKRSPSRGVVVERDINSYSGGSHDITVKRYYVIDMDEFRQIKIDDLFADFQEEARLRDIIYEELRKYSGLERGQALSEGIYYTNEPELTFNFFITDEGLVLHWDPDQIAPHSEGSIEIVLLWQVIRPMMLYTGIELLTKFNIYLFI